MNNLAQCTQLVNDENISKCEQLSPRKDVKQDNSGYFRNLENYCNFLKSIGFKVYNDGKSKFITTYNKKSQKTVSVFCYHNNNNDNFLLDNEFNANVDKYAFSLNGRNVSIDAKKVLAYTQSMRNVDTCHFGDEKVKIHIPDEWVKLHIK